MMQGAQQTTGRGNQRQHGLGPGSGSALGTSARAPWQNVQRDSAMRKSTIAQFVQRVRMQKPNPSQEWLQRLDATVRRVELEHYSSAVSEAQYKDEALFKRRWMLLFAAKTNTPGPGSGSTAGKINPTSWQNPQRDSAMRKSMIAQIVQRVQKGKSNPSQEWLRKLHDVARHVEREHYTSAGSEAQYKDEALFKRCWMLYAAKTNTPGPGSSSTATKIAPTSWQNPHRDNAMRQSMIARMVQRVQKGKSNPSQEWLRKLHDVARHVERELYTSAGSEAQYKDESLFMRRLRLYDKKNFGGRLRGGSSRRVGCSAVRGREISPRSGGAGPIYHLINGNAHSSACNGAGPSPSSQASQHHHHQQDEEQQMETKEQKQERGPR